MKLFLACVDHDNGYSLFAATTLPKLYKRIWEGWIRDNPSFKYMSEDMVRQIYLLKASKKWRALVEIYFEWARSEGSDAPRRPEYLHTDTEEVAI